MLALGTTPGMAQTAQPQAAEPTTPPVTTPAPTPSDPIVLQSPIAPPTATTTPTVPRTTAPTQQPTIVLDIPPAPTAEAETPAAEQRTTATAAAEPRRAVRERPAPTRSVQRDAAPVAAAAPAISPDTPVSSTDGEAIATDQTLAPLPVAEAAPEAMPAETTPAAGPDWVAIVSLALAGLIPLGAIFLAVAWFRRRSRRVDAVEHHEDVAYVDEPAIAPEPPAATSAPVVDEPAPRPVAPAFAATVPPVAATAPARRHPLEGYKGMPNEGAAVSLPSEMPETFEERDALLKKMIAAEPDRANPFRSTKARAKRARLIMQSLGRTFENAKPRFDLSQYTRNWPALAGNRRSFA